MPRHKFDLITDYLYDFVEAHPELLFEIANDIRADIFREIATHKGPLSRKTSAVLLKAAFAKAERNLATIAEQLGLDNWISLLRRFPAQPTMGNWEQYLTLGLIKYSGNINTTSGKLAEEDQSSILLAYTEKDLIDCFRLWHLALLMAEIARIHRWIGKGARLCPSPEVPLNLKVTPQVWNSVVSYDRRRPNNGIMREEGIFIQNTDKTSACFVIGLALSRYSSDYLYVPERNISLLCHYLLDIHYADPLSDCLSAYDEAIEDIFKIPFEAIVHFMVALGQLTSDLIIPIINIEASRASEGKIILLPDDGSENYEHSLRFYFGICHRGYLRFPREILVNRLSSITTPWAVDGNTSERFVKSFIDTFLLQSVRDEIDLSLLRPFPFVYASASEEIYLDLLATFDFLGWIITKAKEWFSSQHGDRFTLAVKRFVGETGIKEIFPKFTVKCTNGRVREIDLLIIKEETAYAVECKAFAKSRNFFRGDPGAVSQRTGRLSQAVNQAKGAAKALRESIARNDLGLSLIQQVEWVVCTPSQEYLNPLDAFGMLSEEIPRICTPEELVRHLNQTL